jgi:tetratricopeptide (TPR) repeat protein
MATGYRMRGGTPVEQLSARVSRLILIVLLVALGCFSGARAQDRNACLQRDGDRSIQACSRIISAGQVTGKDLATIYVLRASEYRANQQYDLAIGDLTKAIGLLQNTEPPDVVASAYVTRASIYLLKGDTTEALADYRGALTMDSEKQQAIKGVAEIKASFAPPVSTNASPSLSQQEPDNARRISELACCLAYYRGEVSLEGWGPKQRCHTNMQDPQTKNKFCVWLRQFYPGRYSALTR